MVKNFFIALFITFYMLLGFAGALSIAVFPQVSWKIILLLIFVISLTITTVLFIAGARNRRNGFAAPLEKLDSTDNKAYRVRPILLAAYVFVSAIIVAYIGDRHRELADIATSSAWAACWIFAWGWILRIMEALRGRYLSRKSR